MLGFYFIKMITYAKETVYVIIKKKWSDRMEASLLLFIQEHIRNAIFDPLVILITHLGDSGIIWIILTIIFLCFQKTRKVAYMMIAAMLLSLLFNNLILKNWVARVRPYDAIEGLHRLIEAQVDWSFPSGHSASSFAAAVVIFKCMDKKIGVPAIILATLISLSRLYVGVHYPTDVLFGIVSGTCIALLVKLIFDKYINKDKSITSYLNE